MINAADPLDEFLEGAGSTTRLGETLETIGLAVSLPTLLLAVGLFVFVRFVAHSSAGDEKRFLRTTIGVLGAGALMGALIEVLGVVTVLGADWFTDLGDATARGPLLRVVAGGLFSTGLAAGRAGSTERVVDANNWILVIASVAAVASFAFDGHTVTEGSRWLMASMSGIHVVAVSIWGGGVLGLVLLSSRRRRLDIQRSMTPVVARFSNVAAVVVISVAAAGLGMSLQIVDGFDDLLTTVWGRLLLLKIGLVLVAGGIGAFNRFTLLPALEERPGDKSLQVRLRRSVTIELAVLVLVGIATVFLVGASVN